MKKALILSVFSLLFSNYYAQDNPKNKIANLLERNNLSQEFEDKLLLISFWSVKDLNSRDRNKEAQRVFKIYENAKLKGGSKGVYFLNMCMDCNALNYTIAVKRDSLIDKHSIYLKDTELTSVNKTFELDSRPVVFLYDKDGNLIKRGLKKEDVFPVLLNLITR
jgi:hypothetical protein